MIANSYWKRVGMVALAYVAAASCTSENWILYIDGKNPSDDGLGQLRDGNPRGKSALEIHNYQLDKLPCDLGKNAASNGIRHIILASVSAPDDFPAEAEKNTIVPFISVRYLHLSTPSLGSPKSFSWIKLLFSNVFELKMPFEALPVRTKEDIAVCNAKKLAMESVRRITLYSGSGNQVDLPILENLRLFPNLELIKFVSSGKFLSLEDARGDDISFLKVDQILLDDVDSISQDVLRKLPTVFPNIRRLFISPSTFEELTSGDSTGTSIKSFDKLKELCIECNSDVHIGAKLAEVFPKLSKLSLSFPSNSDFTIHPPPSEANAAQLGTLKEITIWGGKQPAPFLESFKALSPNCVIEHFM